MKRLFSTIGWSITTGIMAVLLVASIVGSYIVNLYPAAMHMTFGTSDFKTVNDPDAEVKDFYSTDYEFERNGENLFKEDSAMIEEAEAAGAVLLWNKEEALPMSGEEGVSLLGHSSVHIVECGSGSGYSETYDYGAKKLTETTMKDAFESRGFDVNKKLWNFYEDKASSYKATDPKEYCKPWQQWWVNEIPWADYTDDVQNSFSNYGDAAIVIFSRSGGEYSDLHYNYKSSSDTVGNNDKGSVENTSADGGYLGLTDEEEDLLRNVVRLKGENVFKKVIVLINSGNPIQMQDLESYYDGIDACMWIGQPGSTGINAVADLLKGKNMAGEDLIPSGRLTDTWAYDLNSAPATVNDGNYTYGKTELLTGGNLGSKDYVSKYMVYQEGVYIGYRYYETRYADAVMGEGNAASAAGAKHSEGAWSYEGEVAFPFGYGLSYTTFEYSKFGVEETQDGYHVRVDVKNTGSRSGREVVQVYLQKPYTDYDIETGIEKAAVELAGYAKTESLAPGETETVTVDVPKESFKTYDANEMQTYIIEASSEYYLTVATDSHAAINNILEYGDHEVTHSVMGGTDASKQHLGADFVEPISLARDVRTYANSKYTGYEIANCLDAGDINRYANRGENSVTYLSRNDWQGTYPTKAPVLQLNAAMVNDLRFDNLPDDSEYEMPEYGVFKSGSETGFPDVANGDLVAYMFMDAPLYPEREKDNTTVYEDGLVYSEHWEKMWDQLLDQMTFKEQAFMVSNSFHQINGAVSISLPNSKQENGPVGITKRNDVQNFSSLPPANLADENGWTFIAYPCAGVIAASFDADIATRVGEHMSEDMLYLGYNGIYGPGVNMHRSPFGGRAFEYASEDPLLTGRTAAYQSIGIESKGCLAYVKHFALNDMETNRVNCGIWSNEQASREIYLRAFEIAFKEGGASATMNSFTRIGTRWCGGCPELLTTILRDEWGYDGIVISDWVTGGSAMSYVDGVLAGTDTFDGNAQENENDLYVKYADNAAIAQAVRQACKRVIYNVVRTNAMNGTSVSTKVIRVTPWWRAALIGLQAGFGVLTGISAAMLVTSIILRKKRRARGE